MQSFTVHISQLKFGHFGEQILEAISFWKIKIHIKECWTNNAATLSVTDILPVSVKLHDGKEIQKDSKLSKFFAFKTCLKRIKRWKIFHSIDSVDTCYDENHECLDTAMTSQAPISSDEPRVRASQVISPGFFSNTAMSILNPVKGLRETYLKGPTIFKGHAIHF